MLAVNQREKPDPPGVPKTTGPTLFPSQISIFEFMVQSYVLSVRRGHGERERGMEGIKLHPSDLESDS